MLVLSRKCGEQIAIGNNVTLTVISVHGKRVKLGIGAPRGVAIRRSELEIKLEEALHPHAPETGDLSPPQDVAAAAPF